MQNSEILYLISRFLDSVGCSEGAQAVKSFIDSNSLEYGHNKPTSQHILSYSFDRLDHIYNDLDSSILHTICAEYVQRVSANKSACLRSLTSLLGLLKSEGSRHLSWSNNISPLFKTCPRSHQLSIDSIAWFCHSLYQTTTLRKHVLAHRSAIYCLKYDRRSQFLFSASDDYTIKVWDLQSPDGKLDSPLLRHTLRGHLAEIIEVDVSLDNHLLVSVDADCALIIWCLRTGQPLVAFRGTRLNRVISGLAFLQQPPVSDNQRNNKNSPQDGVGWLLVSSYGCGIHFISYRHTQLSHPTRRVRLNSGESFVNTCCHLHLNPTVTFSTNTDEINLDGIETTCASALVLDVSPGGNYVAVGCSDHLVRMFTFSEDDGSPVSAGRLSAHEDGVNSVAFSNSGVQLATGSADGGSCWLWTLRRPGGWSEGSELKLPKRPKCRPCVLRWSKKDKYLFVCIKSGGVHVFRGKTGDYACTLKGHESAVYGLASSPLSEDIVATGGGDGRFFVWKLPSSTATAAPSVLFFYRFPAPQTTTDLGITWVQPANLEEALQPSTAMTTTANPNAEGTDEAADAGAQGPQTQRITSCVALPPADGPGFLVATKAGVISLFAPNPDIDAPPQASDGPPPYEEQFLHWEMDNAALRETPPASNRLSSISRALGGVGPAGSAATQAARNQPVAQEEEQEGGLSEPPPGVLFQLIHEPSGVPFYRLPPGYLTTLRGQPFRPERQRAQIPGRRHCLEEVDLQPTLSLDDEGDEVVVDDIQFCGDRVPAAYAQPSPIQSSRQSLPGKQYLWRSHWLSGEADLIRPLSSLELELAIQLLHIQRDLERSEASQEPTSSNNQPRQCLVNRDEGAIISTDATSTVALSPSSQHNRQSNDDLLLLDADLDPEIELDSEDDSDWSAHMDTDIGWFNRNRRQRPTNRRSRMRQHDPEPYESQARPGSSRPSEGVRPATSIYSPTIRRSTRQSSQRLRSGRQRRERQHQLIVSHIATHTLRRARRSERQRLFRRHRDHNNGSVEEENGAEVAGGAASTTTEDSNTTNPPDSLPSGSGATTFINSDASSRQVAAVDVDQTDLDVFSPPDPRELLKQQLIRSIDYVALHRVTLPLESAPPNGYVSATPHTTNPVFPLKSSNQPPPIRHGPNLDWLSAMEPIATPYVPQLGDRVVYILRGHREYLNRAWGGLEAVPGVDNEDDDATKTCYNFKTLPHGYVCCRVMDMSVHFMRIQMARGPGTSTDRPNRGRRGGHRPHGSNRVSIRRVHEGQEKDKCPDSFVRLVSLRLAVDLYQPYSGLGRRQLQDEDAASCPSLPIRLPEELHVRYHDVDGVLDFLVLRSVFDEAINRSWNQGDVFICPVEELWWRGHALTTFSPLATLDDPWLAVRVRWLDNHQQNGGHPPNNLESDTAVDRLSPWDMHPWDNRLPSDNSDSSSTSNPTTTANEVRISLDRLNRLFGSRNQPSPPGEDASLPGPSAPTAHTASPVFVDVVECMKTRLDKIMAFNASTAFNAPVDLAAFPNYIVVNPYLVDFLLVRQRLENLFYRQSEAIRFDLETILANALRYNEPDSLIVRQAKLVVGLALKALRCHDCTLDQLTEEYTTAVRAEPELDPPLETSISSLNSSGTSATLPQVGQTEPSPSQASDLQCDVTGIKRLRARTSTSAAPPAKRPATSTGAATHTNESIAHRLPYVPSTANVALAEEDQETTDEGTDVLDWRNVCRRLLGELRREERSFFFREPVDFDLYPTYARIVPNPIDLASIGQRLSSSCDQHYSTPCRFLQDLELLVANSRLFNLDPETQVYSDTGWLARWIADEARPRLSLFLGNEPTVPPLRLSISRRGLRRRRVRASRMSASSLSYATSSLQILTRNRDSKVVITEAQLIEEGRGSPPISPLATFSASRRRPSHPNLLSDSATTPTSDRTCSPPPTSSSSSSASSSQSHTPTVTTSSSPSSASPDVRQARRRSSRRRRQSTRMRDLSPRARRPRRSAAEAVQHYFEEDDDDDED